MTKVIIEEQNLIDIAGAIRSKNNETDTYLPSEMADKIENLSTASKTKCSVDIDNFIGDITTDGVLNAPVNTKIDFVCDATTLGSHALEYKFASNIRGLTFSNVSFPNLTLVESYGLYKFLYSDICSTNDNVVLENICFPKLKRIYSYGLSNCFFNALSGARLNDLIISFPELETIDLYGMYYCFYLADYRSSWVSNIHVKFPKLTTVDNYGLSQTFNRNFLLKSASFDALENITIGRSNLENIFYECKNLTTASFPLLKTISTAQAFYYAFYNCLLLENISFPSLEVINGTTCFFACFYNCNLITSLTFPSLTTISGTGTYIFGGNNKTTKYYFPVLNTITLTSLWMAKGTGNPVEEIHFGVANQAAIEATIGYTTLWGLGAGNATVYFDL